MGGGPAGLYFAVLMKLLDRAHDVTVFERNAAGSSHGWGVTFGDDLLGKLHHGDPVSGREIGQATFRWHRQVVDVQGWPVQQASGDGYSIGRQRLLGILAGRARHLGVRLESGHEVTALSQLPAADLIVACDGVNSRVRLGTGNFRTEVRPGVNKYLWLGTGQLFESFLYAFVPTEAGWVWAYAYGAGDSPSTFIVECSPETWRVLGFDAMTPRAGLGLLEKLFERHLGGHQLVAHDGDVRWLNFRTVTNERWYDGRVVLAGDAAHTTHYSTGWGTKLAIEDAISLAGNLRRHAALETALGSYQAERQAALLPPQGEARLSAQWFESLPRYIRLEPWQFSMLLHGRRSPVLPRVSPQLYCRLLRGTEEVEVLRRLRSLAGPKAKAVYGRRHRARKPVGSPAPGAED